MVDNPWEDETAQLQKRMQEGGSNQASPIQHKPNNTGLPEQLKSGVENLSGHSRDNAKVDYNSSKPAQLQALLDGNEQGNADALHGYADCAKG